MLINIPSIWNLKLYSSPLVKAPVPRRNTAPWQPWAYISIQLGTVVSSLGSGQGQGQPVWTMHARRSTAGVSRRTSTSSTPLASLPCQWSRCTLVQCSWRLGCWKKKWMKVITIYSSVVFGSKSVVCGVHCSSPSVLRWSGGCRPSSGKRRTNCSTPERIAGGCNPAYGPPRSVWLWWQRHRSK